jgi:hypothetical protein
VFDIFSFILFWFCPFRKWKHKRDGHQKRLGRRRRSRGPINIPGLLFPTRRRLIPQHPRQLNNDMLVPPLPKKKMEIRTRPFLIPISFYFFCGCDATSDTPTQGGMFPMRQLGSTFYFLICDDCQTTKRRRK